MLMDEIERVKKSKTWSSEPGTVFRVYEVHDRYGKDESGNTPVIKLPEVVEVKKPRKL